MNKIFVQMTQTRFDNLIKPVGSLAKLEKLVCQFAGLRQTTNLDYPKKTLVLFDFAATDLSFQLKCLRAVAGKDVLISVAQGDLLTLPKTEVIAFGHTLHYGDNSALKNKTIAAMSKAMLLAAEQNMLIVLDGADSLRAAKLAVKHNPYLSEHLVASYIGDTDSETSQQLANLSQLLSLHLHSENGLGALLTFDLLDAGIRAYKDMRTFEEAKVEYAVEDLK